MSFQTRVIGILIIGLMVMGLGYERVVNASMSDLDPAALDAKAVAEAVEAAVRSDDTGTSEDSFLKPDISDDVDTEELLEVPAPPGYFDELDASLADDERRPALRTAESGISPDSALAIILDEPELLYYAGSESRTASAETELETEPLMLGEQTVVGGPAGGPEQDLRDTSFERAEAAINVATEAAENAANVSAPKPATELEAADPEPAEEVVPTPAEEDSVTTAAEVQAASSGEVMSVTDRVAAFEEQLTFPFETFEDREIARRVNPRFPSKCRESAEDSEIVIVRFRVASNGRASNPSIAATTNECLNNAALSAARKARFDVKRLRRRTDRDNDFILTYAFENSVS